MVEEIKMPDIGALSMAMGDAEEIKMEDMVKLLNDPKYLETAEKEIDKAMENAKIELSQLGFDLDVERMDRMATVGEEVQEEVDESELDRLLAGGLAFCRKEKECGHKCTGVKNEEQCLPCLQPECAAADESNTNLPSSDELCTICYTCELQEEPCVQLSCGHIFHANCVLELLKHKWSTLRITFAFMSCPNCKKPIDIQHVDEIYDELEKLQILRSEIQVQAMKICKKEGHDQDPRVTTPGDFYYNNLMAFAEAKVSFF